ncbi:MAG TPA: DUF58 domain-containing protein [Thermoplasmata archaeon]|nr:DUF58 domain-containing protein [Thermoplasmata archaeon]
MEDGRLTLTPRGRGVLLAALAVLLVAFVTVNVLAYVVGVFFVALVLADLLEFLRATRGFGPAAFSVERAQCTSFVRAGAPALVTARLTSALPGSFYAELFDAHPDSLPVVEGSPRLLTWWAAGEPLTLGYVVVPRKRGRYEVGPTLVLAHDSLGLAFRSVSLSDPWEIEAIPEPLSVPIPHPRRLPSLVVGQTWVATPGAGSDFRGLREYEPTDELRSIAWTRSGQGTLYVRQNERESLQDLVVLLDIGRTMALGPRPGDALERSIDAAASVLRLAFDEGGRAGIVLFSDHTEAYIPPGRGATHEFRVLRALSGARVERPAGRLGAAVDYVVPRLDRSASLVALSAVDGDPDALAASVGEARHRGHLVYILVPDADSLYPPLRDPGQQAAIGFLLAPEVRRSHTAAACLRRQGASVALFGHDGPLAALGTLYRQTSVAPGAA